MNENERPSSDRARVVEVVETTIARRGGGKHAGDPIRIVTQYWRRDGILLAESDPHAQVERRELFDHVLVLTESEAILRRNNEELRLGLQARTEALLHAEKALRDAQQRLKRRGAAR